MDSDKFIRNKLADIKNLFLKGEYTNHPYITDSVFTRENKILDCKKYDEDVIISNNYYIRYEVFYLESEKYFPFEKVSFYNNDSIFPIFEQTCNSCINFIKNEDLSYMFENFLDWTLQDVFYFELAN